MTDLQTMRETLRRLGDMTEGTALPTSLGDAADCLRIGMNALRDHERHGGRDLLRRAANCADELTDLHRRMTAPHDPR